MRNRIKIIFLVVISTGIMLGCSKNDTPDKPLAPELTQKVNDFIQMAMTEWYFWYEDMPNIDPKFELDSKEYFYKLLSEEDTEKQWSFITDDVEALLASMQGDERSFGWSFAFGKFDGIEEYFAIIEYVIPNSPADDAGLSRGDILMEINGAPITNDNFRELYGGDANKFTLGKRLESGEIGSGDEKNINAIDLSINPVLLSKIIEHEGNKIGYMVYNQFTPAYNSSIDNAFQNFSDNNISHLILDLRYNPGGLIQAAEHLCSCIAPIEVVNENAVLVKLKWNDKKQIGFEDGQIMHNLERYFDKTVPVKLNLDKVYVLTGTGTASASELTITGLDPYLSEGVTKVGETTSGKYTFSITRQPSDFYSSSAYYEDFKNWALQPITGRYANSLSVTEFRDGFMPDIEVLDDLANPLPLGDINEPLLKTAIEDISGTVITATKSAKKSEFPRFTKIDGGFSKFDKNRKEMPVNIKTLN